MNKWYASLWHVVHLLAKLKPLILSQRVKKVYLLRFFAHVKALNPASIFQIVVVGIIYISFKEKTLFGKKKFSNEGHGTFCLLQNSAVLFVCSIRERRDESAQACDYDLTPAFGHSVVLQPILFVKGICFWWTGGIINIFFLICRSQSTLVTPWRSSRNTLCQNARGISCSLYIS